jgi:hypothetical protein
MALSGGGDGGLLLEAGCAIAANNKQLLLLLLRYRCIVEVVIRQFGRGIAGSFRRILCQNAPQCDLSPMPRIARFCQ